MQTNLSGVALVHLSRIDASIFHIALDFEEAVALIRNVLEERGAAGSLYLNCSHAQEKRVL